jgi:hypothetical protein
VPQVHVTPWRRAHCAQSRDSPGMFSAEMFLLVGMAEEPFWPLAKPPSTSWTSCAQMAELHAQSPKPPAMDAERGEIHCVAVALDVRVETGSTPSPGPRMRWSSTSGSACERAHCAQILPTRMFSTADCQRALCRRTRRRSGHHEPEAGRLGVYAWVRPMDQPALVFQAKVLQHARSCRCPHEGRPPRTSSSELAVSRCPRRLHRGGEAEDGPTFSSHRVRKAMTTWRVPSPRFRGCRHVETGLA